MQKFEISRCIKILCELYATYTMKRKGGGGGGGGGQIGFRQISVVYVYEIFR